MSYKSLTVLIPGHSLEDFPYELPEQQAEGLLNAFTVLWHPLLLSAAGSLPDWHRADEPPGDLAGRLIIVPTASDDWLPCTWLEDTRDEGGRIITGVSEREALLEQVLSSVAVEPDVALPVDPDLVADFLALGHCQLQVELLTRQMRYFPDRDEARFAISALAAAAAAVAGDRTATESHLRNCFEMLLEARERFYPVDCYLADLCLLSAEQSGPEWQDLVGEDWPVSFLATGADWESLGARYPTEIERLRERWSQGAIEVLGGEWDETGTALRSTENLLWQFRRGRETFKRLFGRVPVTWARRRFGIGSHLPQLLDKLDYRAALHFVLDDGLYPDEEHAHMRWEGRDGSVIDATSRIPLAADAATSFLRFPQRMSESMDYDHSAVVIFARWPKLHTPWLEDFHRIQKYAPVLGRFVTFSQFFEATDTPGRLSAFPAADYLSPQLVRCVARQEPDPISRYCKDWSRYHRYESASWMQGVASLLTSREITASDVMVADTRMAEAGPEADPEQQQLTETWLSGYAEGGQQQMAQSLLGDRGSSSGSLIINTLSFPRCAVVRFDSLLPVPERGEGSCVFASQWDTQDQALLVDLPPCGFVWLPDAASSQPPVTPEHDILLAEDLVLRNEFFEVRLSEITGGIGQIRTYRRSPNRLSQQLAFRFPRERSITYGEGDEVETIRTAYSEMRLAEARVVADGPTLGQIETQGQIVDQQTEIPLAEYRQTIRVWRGCPIVDIEIELEVHRLPEGDPWSNYFAARFAWHDPESALTASMHEGAHPVTAERVEAPHFIEIASADRRTTIFPLGRPFHRKTGPRMLDTLLVVAGETQRKFRMVIAVDEEFPQARARELMTPVMPLRSARGPAHPASAWLFQLDARNVQLIRVLPPSVALYEPGEATASVTTSGLVVRLQETEGRQRTTRLDCYRKPVRASQLDLNGKRTTDLVIEGHTILVEVVAYEICDIAVEF